MRGWIAYSRQGAVPPNWSKADRSRVIRELADKEAIKRWYNSPAYQKTLPRRIDNATGRAFIVEGVS
jgi:uncharacterized protein (DUF1330 family)